MRKKFIKYKILTFFFLFLVSLLLQGQNSNISLEDIEAKKDQDTTKVNLYIELGKKYLAEQKMDSAILISNRGLFLAKKLEYNYGIGESYAFQGDVKVIQNELFQALDSYLTSIEFFKDEHKGMLVSVFLVIGNIYVAQSNYPKALEYYQKGQVISDSLNLVSRMVHFYNNKGELYHQIGQYEDAINSYNSALEIHQDNSDSIGIATIQSGLSVVYLKMNNVNQARFHLEKALIIYKQSLNNEGLLNAYNSMAAIEKKEDNYVLAINYYKKGLEYFNKIGPEYKGPKSILEVRLFENIGFCYLQNNDFNNAEINLVKAYKIAKKNGQLGILKNTTLYLSDLYDLKGNTAKSYEYFREYNSYSDSLSQEENIKKITQLQMQFNFDQELKQREIEQARMESRQKRKELIYIMVSSSILLALIILLLFFRLQKLKVKKISLEKKTLLFDLDYKNKELTTNVMYLLKKNEFIIKISDRLKKARYDFKPENRKIVDDVIRELEHSTSEGAWTDFEVRFQEVHAGFYQKLNDKFPDLSPNELKLCAFLRLNMSTKEISTITFQSPKSISMARFRLRKKMGVSSYANLITYLNQF